MAKQVVRVLTLAGFLLAGLTLAAIFARGAGPSAQRISFVIATGPTGGTYFPIGEAIAGIISHPPGVYRCERAGVCGPSGLIASVKTSQGAVSNVLAVNAGTVAAGFAQSDVVREAVAGKGAFRRSGPQKNVRILADLFPEEVHLIAAKNTHIKSVSDLKGKRVGIGADHSGTIVTARAILSAYRISLAHLRVSNDPYDVAAEKLTKGQLDAMFFVGGAPVPLVRELLANGHAVPVPIADKGRKQLLARDTALSAMTIPAGVYPDTGPIETVGVDALLVVNNAEPDWLIYGINKALFNPANRAALAGSHRAAQSIRVAGAASDLPAPLHPGAARYFAEIGKLPKGARESAGLGKP